MKTIISAKFRYSEMLKVVLIYFIMLIAVSISALISGIHDKTAVSNIDAVYLYSYYLTGFLAFFIGICSYKSQLRLLLQNGVSREHIHYSFLLFLPINILLYLVNTALDFAFVHLSYLSSEAPVNWQPAPAVLILVFCAAMSIGYMISAFIYGTRGITKIITAAVLVLLILFLIIHSMRIGGSVEIALVAIYCFLFGSVTGFVYFWHLALALVSVILFSMSVSHIITSRSTVKK